MSADFPDCSPRSVTVIDIFEPDVGYCAVPSFNPALMVFEPSPGTGSEECFSLIHAKKGGQTTRFVEVVHLSAGARTDFRSPQLVVRESGAMKFEFSNSLSRNKIPNPLVGRALGIVQASQVVAIERGGVSSLKVILSEIERAFSDGNLELVDEILEYLDPKLVPSVVRVGVLRSTFRARKQLRSWSLLLAKVAECVACEGRNPVKTLPGLLSNDDRNLPAVRAAIF